MTAHTPYRRRSATAERSIVSSSGEVKRSRRDIGYPALHSTTPFPSAETACPFSSSGRYSWRMQVLPLWVRLSSRLPEVASLLGWRLRPRSCGAPRRDGAKTEGAIDRPLFSSCTLLLRGPLRLAGFLRPSATSAHGAHPLLRRGFLSREEESKPSLPRKSRPARSSVLDSSGRRGAAWVTVRFSAASKRVRGTPSCTSPARFTYFFFPLSGLAGFFAIWLTPSTAVITLRSPLT